MVKYANVEAFTYGDDETHTEGRIKVNAEVNTVNEIRS